MNTEVVIDQYYIDLDQRDDVKRMASLGYRPAEIAMAIGLPPEDVKDFIRDADTPGTTVFNLIKEGLLVTKAEPEVMLHKAAEAGSIDAIKELNIVNFRHAYNRMIDEMDDDNM